MNRLRVMAIVRWLLLTVVTLVAVRAVWTYWGPESETHASHADNRFYCPMHPEIRSPDPGECPICHMTLEPIPVERQAQTSHAEHAAAAPADVVAVSVDDEKQRAIGLATSVVTDEMVGGNLRVPGVIAAPETGLAQVRVRAAGFVEKVDVRQTGVRVSRGQTLAWIYSPDIYRAQEEFLAASRWSAAGANAMDTVGAATTANLAQAARRNLELLGLSDADLDAITRAGQPLRAIPLRAPSGGYVTRFNALLGFRADPETVLYEIADLSTVWVVASVHERDLVAAQVGTSARFALAGQPTSIEARVDLIEPQLDESTRTSRVRLTLRNKDGELRPGQFGEVVFALPAGQGLFVPRDAVIHTGEHQYVYVATATDHFEPRTVRTGTAVDGRVQIVEGLAKGERVVTRGSFMLDSESRLQASLAAEPAR